MDKLKVTIAVNAARTFETKPTGPIIIGEKNEFADLPGYKNLVKAFTAKRRPDGNLQQYCRCHRRLDPFGQPKKARCLLQLNCTTARTTKGQFGPVEVACETFPVSFEKQALNCDEISALPDCRNDGGAIAHGAALTQRCAWIIAQSRRTRRKASLCKITSSSRAA
jgi:hypothetical protein